MDNKNNNKKKLSFWQKIFSVKNAKDGRHKVMIFLGIKISFKRKIRITKKEALKYIDYVQNNQLIKKDFVKMTEGSYDFNSNNTKAIAFYLPQYHDFKENIKWFGRGFSEWTNTSKAVPQYTGHYQPHIPIDVGYYNLENIDIMKRQIELAKKYGIYGFSFYYYWYSGEKIMEKPINKFLNDSSLDMPFFLFWANENWTMLWGDGNDKKILHKQELHKGDAEKFMNDALPFMKDSRYIKIGNRPLLIIYNPLIYDDYEVYISFNKKIRKIAKENGFDDLYILTTTMRADSQHIDYKNFKERYQLDALFEFFPQGIRIHNINKLTPKILNSKFKGLCYDTKEFVDTKKYLYSKDDKLYKGVFPLWDNTSRKCYNGAIIYENDVVHYKKWLKGILEWTKKYHSKEEQYVFINAWNEWAEGAHLEPDAKYGYSFLEATKEALEETGNNM